LLNDGIQSGMGYVFDKNNPVFEPLQQLLHIRLHGHGVINRIAADKGNTELLMLFENFGERLRQYLNAFSIFQAPEEKDVIPPLKMLVVHGKIGCIALEVEEV